MSQDTFQKVKDQKEKVSDAVSKKKLANGKLPEDILATDLQTIKIFSEISEKSKEIIPKLIPSTSQVSDITNDNNLIQYDGGNLALWGLKSNEKINEIALDEVSFVHCGFDADGYFVGFKNGDVKEYDSAKMEDNEMDYTNIGSEVTSIVTSMDYVIYSSIRGKVILYEYDPDYDEEAEDNECTVLKDEAKDETKQHRIICLKLSVDKNFLYGLLDKSPDETMLVWNVITKKMVHKHDLDIEDKQEYKEDVNKLMIHHTEDASLMFIRSCFRKGVKVLSFDDGVKIDEIPKMHNNSILQILIRYNKKKKHQTLITCAKDKKVKVWDWMNKKLLATLSSHTDEVTSIALSNDSNQSMLFSGSLDKRLIAWHTSLYFKLFEITCEHPLYTIRITTDNEMLVALAKEGQMSTLQLEENLDSVRLNLPREVYENVDMNITNNNKFIIFQVEEDEMIEVWNVESKVLAYKIPAPVERIAVITSPDSRFLFYTSELNEISQMDIEKHKVVARYKGSHTSSINAISVSPDGKRMVTAGETGQFCFYLIPEIKVIDDKQKPQIADIKTIENYNELPKIDGMYWMTIFMHGEEGNSKCITQTLDNEVIVIDVIKCQVISKITIPKSINEFCDIAVTLDNKRILSTGSSSTRIVEIDVEKMKEDQVADAANSADDYASEEEETHHSITVHKSNHSEGAAWGQVTHDGKYYISSSYSESIIWDLKTMKTVLEQGIRFVGLYSQNRLCRGVVQDGLYMRWKPQILQQYDSDIVIEEEPEAGKLNKDKADTVVEAEEIHENSNEIKVTGPFNKVFPKILKTMIEAKVEDKRYYLLAMKDNQIQPQKLNLIHYFAYNDNSECLQFAFDLGVKYQQDSRKRSPLEFAMKRNSYDCTDTILLNIYQNQSVIKAMKHEEITQLIWFSPSKLSLFFENIIEEDDSLVNFGLIKNGKDQIFKTIDANALDKSDLEDMIITTKLADSEQLPITFKKIQMDLNFTPGSKQSIEFHKQLAQTECKEIFKTVAIKQILYYKWHQSKHIAKTIALVDLAIFLIYIIMTQPDIFNNDYRFYPLFSVFAILGTFLTFFEVVQFATKEDKKSYFYDIFNLTDITKYISLWFYIFLIITGKGVAGHHGLAAFLNFFLFFKIFLGLSQFRQFRVLFTLVKEVGKDMSAFAGFQLLAMILFGTTLYQLNTHTVVNPDDPEDYDNVEIQTIFQQILNVYLLCFGEFSVDNYDGQDYTIFIMATILLQLIMLNLLIAIMSDTFARVMDEIEETDGMALNNLILDVEALRFRKRNIVKEQFLHWVEFKTEGDNSWGGKVKMLNNAMSQSEQAMMNAIKVQQQRIQTLSSQMGTQTTLGNMKIDELAKKIDNIQTQLLNIAKAAEAKKDAEERAKWTLIE